MSFDAMRWAMQQDVPSTHAFAVLVVLADHADDNGICWPSQKTIAEKTKQSDRSVRNQIDQLMKAGLLERKDAFGRQAYRLVMDMERKEVPLERNVVPLPDEEKAERGSCVAERGSAKAERGSAPSEPVRTSHEADGGERTVGWVPPIFTEPPPKQKNEGEPPQAEITDPDDPNFPYINGPGVFLKLWEAQRLFNDFSFDGNPSRFKAMLDRKNVMGHRPLRGYQQCAEWLQMAKNSHQAKIRAIYDQQPRERA